MNFRIQSVLTHTRVNKYLCDDLDKNKLNTRNVYMFEVDILRISGVAGRTGVPQMTGVAGITGVPQITGVAGRTGVTQMTGVAGTQFLYIGSRNLNFLYMQLHVDTTENCIIQTKQ